MGVEPKIVGIFPQNGWFIMENLIKMDDLGVKTPIFGLTPMSGHQNPGFPLKPILGPFRDGMEIDHQSYEFSERVWFLRV